MEHKYFKKKKMYVLLTNIIGTNGIEPRINASYEFYRGSEWLKVGRTDLKEHYELFRCKDYVSLNIYTYDITTDKYNCIDRKCYKAVNEVSEKIECTYDRMNIFKI